MPESSDTPASAQPPSLTIPQGWTNEPSDMRLDYYWSGDEGLKTELEEDYRLGDVQPLITRLHSGDVYFIFQSNSTSKSGYYIWNGISQEVYQITEPSNLEGIYRKIDERSGFLGGLETVEVAVEDEEDEGEDEEGVEEVEEVEEVDEEIPATS